MDKKQLQLGMNPSTASGRLVKDLLFNFVKGKLCCHCGTLMTRDNFSIEHVEPWLDSENPVERYFNIDNIDYAHLSCNVKQARKPRKLYDSIVEKRKHSWARYADKHPYSADKRRDRYLKYGT